MDINFPKIKNQYKKCGYIIIKKVFDKESISKVISETKSCNGTFYYDDNENIRRVEQIYKKGNNLKKLNNKLLLLLKKIFQKDFIIFKDKLNFKPAGGEGFKAHYDGIFQFTNGKKKKKGWYEYGNYFINILIALDKCTKENGALELAREHKGGFDKLLKNTNQDGTPILKEEVESILKFNLIKLNVGDIVIFSNKCPHRSKKNRSAKFRRTLYYSYSLKKNGSKYNLYFKEKEKSRSLMKAL